MGGLLHLVQQKWDGQGPSPPRPLIAVPNVTAYPSTAVEKILQDVYCLAIASTYYGALIIVEVIYIIKYVIS